VLLPLPALVVWVSSIGYGCLTDWVNIRPEGVQFGEAARCFATLVLTSAPLSLALFVMLRHAAAFGGSQVCITGSIAVAGLTASALSLFHNLDATAMILVWNLGAAALIIGAGSLFGTKALASMSPSPLSGKR